MFTVHHVERCIERKQASANLEGGEVRTKQNDTFPLVECLMQVFQTFYMYEFLETSV